MDNLKLKMTILNLLVIPNNYSIIEYEKDKFDYNQHFNGLNVLDLLEFSHEEYDKLEANPIIENPIIDEFLQRINNLVLEKKVIESSKIKSINTDFNFQELFDLFKRGFYTDLSLKKIEFEQIKVSFNTYFLRDAFFEYLFQKYNHDEIYEEPDEFDNQILLDIKKELRSQSINDFLINNIQICVRNFPPKRVLYPTI